MDIWVVLEFLVFEHNAAISVHIRVFVWMYVFSSLRHMFGSGISGSQGR